MVSTNYLQLGELIESRLKEKIPDVDTIMALVDLAAVMEGPVSPPAIVVYYVNESLGDMAGNGVIYETKQVWAVVLMVKNLRLIGYRRAELGELITRVLNALQGWTPSPRFSPLYREQSDQPVENPGGYVFFPLHFSANFITIGDGDGY